ncbi:MAG TPA: hypothetical protein DEQ02_04555 [Ruminococcaceae bacterium]|nr:hypothetical protein [Oscillospiraceae bacterium]
MKKTIAVMALVVLFVSVLTGCGGGGGDTLKGTWEGPDTDGSVCTFVIDGKGGLKLSDDYFFDNAPGSYTITGENEVEIKMEVWEKAQTFTFSVTDNKLTLTAPADALYASYELTKK